MKEKTRKILIVSIILLILLLILLGIFLSKDGKYKVEFHANGKVDVVEVKKGDYLKRPNDPVNEGYNFIGWYNEEKLYDFNSKVTSNLKLEAKWQKQSDGQNIPAEGTKYKVVFKNYDDMVIQTIEVKENDIILAKPNDPSREGYNFVGWYLDGKEYLFTEKVTSDIVLIAQYEKIPENVKTYTVTFNSDGGSKISSKKIEENKTVSKPTNPTKTGYQFVSWQLDGKDYDFTTKVTKDITLNATWKALEKYTVTFNSDGGSAVKSATVYEEETVSKPTNPTKTGYQFVSWQLDGKDYDFKSKVTKDITLKATWKEATKCTVTFDSDGGSSVSSITVYCGESIGTLPTPTKQGNTFEGWYSGSTKYTNTTKVTANVTLKAKWTNGDQATLEKALASLKNINITKGGQSIQQTYTGCTVTSTPEKSLSQITRDTKDTNVNIKVSVTCGTASGNKTVTGVIKASTLKYTEEANSNQANYNVRVYDGSTEKTGYKLYNMSGSLLGTYSSNDGYVAVNNGDISGYPNFKLKFTNDTNTIYVVSKK